jgi:hypothetical protein
MNNRYASVVVATALAFVFVAGCATQSMSGSQRKAIRSVAIAKNVPLPPQPTVHGKAMQTGTFWGGPLVMMAMMGSETSDVVKFKSYLVQSKIDVGDIVRQEFGAQLAATRAFPAIVDEGADATFQLEVAGYGLAPGFSMSPTNKPVRPTLNVVAKLVAPDGKVLWQNSDYVTGMGEVAAHQVDLYYTRPELLEQGFRQAAQLVMKELLKDIAAAD